MLVEERQCIELWKREVVSRLGWNHDREPKQREYEYLSREIFAKTQVELSTTTLRRIWHIQYKSLPQVHTLNAMATFLGHADWHAFKKSTHSFDEPARTSTSKYKSPVKTWMLAGSVLLLVALLGFGLYSGDAPAAPDFPVTLKSDQPRYHGVPATAGFQYDIQEATAPVEIELSWNPLERTELDPAKNLYTGVYYYPDYHSTKLLSGGHVLAHIPVYVTTDDWHALVMKKENDVHPIYIEASDFLAEGSMGFDRETLTPYLLESPEQIHSVFTFSNPVLEAFDGDNLKLSMAFRSIQDKSTPPCAGMDILLKAEGGTARIPFKSEGCFGEIRMHYGRNMVSGKESDLSMLTTDLFRKQSVQLAVKDGKVSVILGQNEPYRFNYQGQLGKLKVLKFVFSGFGFVSEVRLDSPGTPPWIDQFERESSF